MQQTLEFLTQCDKNRQVTQAASQLLGDTGLIEPWPLKIERARFHEKHNAQQAGQPTSRDIDSLLEGDDDDLTFDFGD